MGLESGIARAVLVIQLCSFLDVFCPANPYPLRKQKGQRAAEGSEW